MNIFVFFLYIFIMFTLHLAEITSAYEIELIIYKRNSQIRCNQSNLFILCSCFFYLRISASRNRINKKVDQKMK